MSSSRSRPPPEGAGESMAEDDRRYRNLVEVSPDAILLNRGGKVALANPACARLFGARDPSEMIGRPAMELFHPSYHAIIRDRIAEIEAGRAIPLLEERIIRLDGEVRDVEVVAAAFPDGDEVAIQVVLRDITDRKRVEAALQESERRAMARATELQAVLDTVPAAVWIARDREGTRIDANRFGAELLRRPRGTNVSVTAPPGERPSNFRPMKDGVELREDELPIQAAARFGREFRDFEFDLVFDDGTVRHLLGNSSPIPGEDGTARGSVGAFVDITERKEAEALAESLARFPRENPDPVARLTRELTVRYANDATHSLLGDLGLAAGRPAPVELAEAARRALETGRRVKVEVHHRGVVFQFSVVPVGDEVNLYGQDITARKEAEDALRVETRRKTEFLAVLSHELRTPLASLRNSITLLERAPPDGDVGRRARAILHRQVEHLSRLVDDLLDVARIHQGKIELRRSRIDAREPVRRVCEDMNHAFGERGVALHRAESAGAIWIDADPARMEQMVGNLVNNALKFTEPGGEVHVDVRKVGVACEVSVRDDGAGVDPEDLDSIFDPFVQAERTRQGARGGMGIGLSLVRELAVGHGGWVRARSEGPGRGTEIVLRLPLAVDQTGAGAAPPTVEAGAGATGLSILIVEDDEDARESLCLMLALDGHDVNVVATGGLAVEAVLARPPDVIICDVGLPDMNGFEVLRAIRAARPGIRTFAIALTGYAQPEDREKAFAAGFDTHLAKPPRFDRLDEILAGVARMKGRPGVP